MAVKNGDRPMIVKNKLDRTFGPFGTSMGFFMIILGIIATYFSLFGLLIAVIGAFICFTSSSTVVDIDKKRIRFSDNLFGIIPVGKWISIQPGMKLGLKKFHRGYLGYIRGIQKMTIHYTDIRIFLYDSENKQIAPIKKFDSYESSLEELNNLSSLLGLENSDKS
jgi:hypothetical protein